MIQATEATVRSVVEEVLAQLGGDAASVPAGGDGDWGVFSRVDDAVAAAGDGFERLKRASLEERGRAIECVRRICDTQAEELGRLEFEETKIGRLDHKIEKLLIIKLVPGIEFLRSDATSGDNGLTVTEYAP